jgi:PhnB protein
MPAQPSQWPTASLAPPRGVTLHLQVDNAAKWFDRAVSAGATVVMPPGTMFWGDRCAQALDPFGHRWTVGSRIGSGN